MVLALLLLEQVFSVFDAQFIFIFIAHHFHKLICLFLAENEAKEKETADRKISATDILPKNCPEQVVRFSVN